MIQMQTNLDVADNSGARQVQCIKVLGGSKRMHASVGDIIVVSIKENDKAINVLRYLVNEGYNVDLNANLISKMYFEQIENQLLTFRI